MEVRVLQRVNEIAGIKLGLPKYCSGLLCCIAFYKAPYKESPTSSLSFSGAFRGKLPESESGCSQLMSHEEKWRSMVLGDLVVSWTL